MLKTIVSDFTEEKWLAVGASARYGTQFMFARAEQKKEASFMFLETHERCHERLRPTSIGMKSAVAAVRHQGLSSAATAV